MHAARWIIRAFDFFPVIRPEVVRARWWRRWWWRRQRRKRERLVIVQKNTLGDVATPRFDYTRCDALCDVPRDIKTFHIGQRMKNSIDSSRLVFNNWASSFPSLGHLFLVTCDVKSVRRRRQLYSFPLVRSFHSFINRSLFMMGSRLIDSFRLFAALCSWIFTRLTRCRIVNARYPVFPKCAPPNGKTLVYSNAASSRWEHDKRRSPAVLLTGAMHGDSIKCRTLGLLYVRIQRLLKLHSALHLATGVCSPPLLLHLQLWHCMHVRRVL